MYICEYTALGLVPKNLFILRYCFTHRKNNSMSHLFLYISVISFAFKSKRLVKNWMISSLSFIKVINLKSPFTICSFLPNVISSSDTMPEFWVLRLVLFSIGNSSLISYDQKVGRRVTKNMWFSLKWE